MQRSAICYSLFRIEITLRWILKKKHSPPGVGLRVTSGLLATVTVLTVVLGISLSRKRDINQRLGYMMSFSLISLIDRALECQGGG